MPRFLPRPLAVMICALFASTGLSHAIADERKPGTADELAPQPAQQDNEQATQLRVERRFHVLARKKNGGLRITPLVGLPGMDLRKEDTYPTFLIADEVIGRQDELTEAIGHAELRRSDALLYADRMSYRPNEDEVEASGHVRLLQEGSEIESPHLKMKMAEQIGFAEQAEYRFLREVRNKYYTPLTGIAGTSASSSSQTVSGAPMMLHIPNIYGLPTTAPEVRTTEASGTAERINFEGDNHFRLQQATYSTCKPGERDWYLRSDETVLDYDEEVGEARHASLWFKDVPLFYSPQTSFSLNQKRRSGFMHPMFSTSTRTGLDITTPYYWNIAPNYDATFYPRFMSKRGFQLGADVRYLDYNFQGETKLEYTPKDSITEKQRYAYRITHEQNLGQGVSAAINWQAVSDDLYWQDMSSRLLQTSLVQLPQQLIASYSPFSWLHTSTQVLRYQTLQTDPANPVARPYFLEPQINIAGYQANFFKTDLSLTGQYSRFSHPTKDQGDRVVFYPQVSLPIINTAFQITPKVGLHMSKYALERRTSTGDNEITRTLPTLSIDASAVFERESSLFDFDYIQTLEPRLYYVRIPYRDQSTIPVFDSGLADFNFAQIFSENRYNGFDRINDANQLTAGVTSRIIDAHSGVELFKAMIGERYYFSEQQVLLPGETVRNRSFSNLILGLTGLVAPKTYADMAWEYDYRNQENERFSAGMRYQPDYGRVISASYRYTRMPITTTDTQGIDQIDVAAQWPIAARWYAIGRQNYSMRDHHPLETIMGVEYNAGCWATRFVSQRLEATSGSPVTSMFFQLELNDFGSVGANPLQLLRRTIPGYGKTNELSNTTSPGGSLLTTE